MWIIKKLACAVRSLVAHSESGSYPRFLGHQFLFCCHQSRRTPNTPHILDVCTSIYMYLLLVLFFSQTFLNFLHLSLSFFLNEGLYLSLPSRSQAHCHILTWMQSIPISLYLSYNICQKLQLFDKLEKGELFSPQIDTMARSPNAQDLSLLLSSWLGKKRTYFSWQKKYKEYKHFLWTKKYIF